jgi:glycosyl-4,4'-diaponeurosporenoate acyltransferase
MRLSVLVDVSDPLVVLLSSLTWFLTSVVVGAWAAGWSPERVDEPGPVTSLRAWEDHGRWWQRHLRVRAWKDRLPEAGAVFGGFAKTRVPSRSTSDLALFRRETIRAERVHWLILASTPIHAVWCRPAAFAAMVAFGLVFSLPFIVIQRSNRGRLERLIGRRGGSPDERRISRAVRRPATARHPAPAGG